MLFGAVDAIDDRQGFKHTAELTWWWELRDQLIAALGDPRFESLSLEGRALSHDEAVRSAMASIH